VTTVHHFRGRLLRSSASLLILLSSELLKWQFPAEAAGEMLSKLVSGAMILKRAFYAQG
jgi:hypothetical protein